MTLCLVALPECFEAATEYGLGRILYKERIEAERQQDAVHPVREVRCRENEQRLVVHHARQLAQQAIGREHVLDDLAAEDDIEELPRPRLAQFVPVEIERSVALERHRDIDF